jgi:diadenosine tetraphosphate (Ap4A) HIT family hydrolase
MMTDFALDARLATDTEPVAALELCDLRLINDARFPWLILVPRLPNVSELIDLERTDLTHLMDEVATASRALHAVTSCDKLNLGALGNVVSQLHIHVVGRFVGDAAWPGPVWGSGEAIAYSAEARTRLIELVRTALPT